MTTECCPYTVEQGCRQEAHHAPSRDGFTSGRSGCSRGIMTARELDDRHRADAATELVERYAAGLYQLGMRVTGRSDDAEAAAREALLTAARKRETSADAQATRSWIYRIAARAAYLLLRARRPGVGDIALAEVAPPLDTDGHFAPMDD